ncbi:MAG: DUF6285 domain-containing protein [Alphaproteobacteria bacterium]|nr:DUF6285 domain-containing protein [Alphaproteobacteria bacterium]
MKPDDPSAANLLATASLALKEEIAPLLKGEERLTVLMAIAAIETACREVALGPDLAAHQAACLAAHNGDGLAESLCKAIRAGVFDAGTDAVDLHARLLEDAKKRCAISNPRYLAAAEADWTRRTAPNRRD